MPGRCPSIRPLALAAAPRGLLLLLRMEIIAAGINCLEASHEERQRTASATRRPDAKDATQEASRET